MPSLPPSAVRAARDLVAHRAALPPDVRRAVERILAGALRRYGTHLDELSDRELIDAVAQADQDRRGAGRDDVAVK